MEEKNYWPDLDCEESTKEVFSFIKLLEKQLHEKYKGKLKCEFEEIVYESFGIGSMNKALSDISRIVGPQEEKGALEKDKNKVSVRQCKEYKFLIYNNNYFFRVFDVKIGEYFPIEIRPAEELANTEYKYSSVESMDEFKQRVEYYLNHKTIKDVIRYMTSL